MICSIVNYSFFGNKSMIMNTLSVFIFHAIIWYGALTCLRNTCIVYDGWTLAILYRTTAVTHDPGLIIHGLLCACLNLRDGDGCSIGYSRFSSSSTQRTNQKFIFSSLYMFINKLNYRRSMDRPTLSVFQSTCYGFSMNTCCIVSEFTFIYVTRAVFVSFEQWIITIRHRRSLTHVYFIHSQLGVVYEPTYQGSTSHPSHCPSVAALVV